MKNDRHGPTPNFGNGVSETPPATGPRPENIPDSGRTPHKAKHSISETPPEEGPTPPKK